LFFWNNFFKKDKKIDKEKKRLSKLMKQSGVMGNDLMQKEMVDASVSMSKNLSKDTSLVAVDTVECMFVRASKMGGQQCSRDTNMVLTSEPSAQDDLIVMP
jgi:hypothetical protein